ncbi:DNA phosphorothioation-dependent restriction protein DptH [Parashewanella spongiae]|uniref:DNA phosphorothioation-dependent restriction protein DptH n=1 Tax=Parashewanella spongiae TaxID=342950 RepID=A0A3A6U5P4_9GAMM|nr:DNA phosphorothioation-dependent restriction protein DptH [Parashewanella spongiae]MCL1076570.1 DNA phosphorothioation-dependent restriction protein DptH [Parashewanella spongiae]RJY19529.1 DNA phosphorothioation-dependent restriction protein DptH [Parashewanella spongiae]
MSVKQFEQFLVELFLADAANNIKPNSRYQFKSPDAENSRRLYAALVEKSNDTLLTPKGVALPYIEVSSPSGVQCKIIPILHKDEEAESEGFTENFISHLRDVVSSPSDYLSGSALLIIHNSLLDTLINSATDLGIQDQVWSPKRIHDALKGLIDHTDKAKDVSECLLADQFETILEDGATMFGFESLYKAVQDGDLRFNELGMFNDPLIIEMSGNKKQIKKRLEANRELHDQISFNVEHFAGRLPEQLKAFSEKFVDKHFTDDAWKDLDFEVYEQEKKRNLKQQLVLVEEQITEGTTITARNRAESKAGQRDRQIIIELDEDVNEFEIKLNFQGAGNLDKSQFSIQPKQSPIKAADVITRNSLKSASATLKGAYQNEPLFFNLTLKRDVTSENHKFRCLVVRKGEFYLEPLKNMFIIEHSKQRITLNTEDNKLELSENNGHTFHLTDTKQVIDNSSFSVADFENLANESDEIEFFIKSGDNKLAINIEGAIATDSLSLPLLLNKGRYFKLFSDEYFGEFYSKKGKVGIDNSEFIVPGLRLKLLRLEEEFINTQSVALIDGEPFELEQLKTIDDDIHQSYQSLFKYLAVKRTTPSLVSWGEEYTDLVEDIVECYLSYLASIETGNVLKPKQKQALKIGLVKRDGEEFYSPFHPLILSYFLQLRQSIKQDDTDSFNQLADITIQRLTPKGLIPYTYHSEHGFAYTQQIPENAFWLKSVPQEKSCLSFVRKLVKEKIDEFQSAFAKLFANESKKSIIINAVNQELSEELFLGLVDYVKTNLDSSASIHVNLYDESFVFNAFDKFAETSSYSEIKQWLELDKGKVREYADTIIDLLRTRLTYSKFTNRDSGTDGQAYAHLTFFRNNNKVDCADIAIDHMDSGVACDGLLTGEASTHDHGAYFTGFGLHNVEYDDIAHLKMAKYYGLLLQPASKPNTKYNGSNALALAVSEDFKQLLHRSYESSIWTTIIDPKVTLDFFHSNQDVVLIHYSDQYTSSSSYDAITVTAQRDLFEKVLQQGDGGNINEFNAFNGDWLLKMMTAHETINKERKGVIGAYKFVTSLVNDSDITWVPLSVAEMIRVSGNIGLKMSDSEFSRNVQGYKKGAISDDVLFVGFKNQQMYLLPVEVKTGATPNYVKAVEQAKELLRYLSENILGKDNLTSKLYRGLFIRQVLMQIDKYKLYKVFDCEYFESLLDEKELWLQGNYSLARLTDYPEGLVISHLDSASCHDPDYKLIDGVLRVELPISLLKMLVETPLQSVLNDVEIAKICVVPEEYKLSKGAQTELLEAEKTTWNDDVINDEQLENTNEANSSPSNVIPIAPEQSTKVAEPAPVAPYFSPSGHHLNVLFGHNAVTKAPLNWEPTNTAKFMNTNTGIIGTMGTGKTQFTKSVITQLYQNHADNVNSAPIGMLIFDYKSDYVDDKFLNATNGKQYHLHKLPYNPLSLFGDTPMLPVHTARGFSETMGKAFGLGQKQQLKLRRLVGEVYELAGIKKSDPTTWTKPAPTIEDVWTLFLDSEPDEDSLFAALESLAELEVFEDQHTQCKSLYELIDGITVIKLAEYPPQIQSLVVALTLDLFYSQMQKKGKPEVQGDFRQVTKMILVDEADNFMSQNFPSLRKILKEGREYGVGVILSTQDITHFQTGENDYSSYVLTWIVHRVAKIKPQDIKAIFSINEKAEQERLMETISKLEKHYSLYIDGAKQTVKMRDKAFWELLEEYHF